MRTIRRLGWAAVLTAVSAAPTFGQVAGPGGTSTTITPSGNATTTQGGFGGGNAGGMSSSGDINAQLVSQQVVSIAPPSSNTASTNRALSTTNQLARYYSNPYYQGTYANNVSNVMPGGFGAASFGTVATANTGTGGATAGGFGARAGAGGLSGIGGVNSSDPSGVIVPLPRSIAYAAQADFPVTAPAPAQIQAAVQGVLNGSIANPQGVQVLLDGNNVVLRGLVRDQKEARLAEGLVRLTPGVGLIRNELAFPTP